MRARPTAPAEPATGNHWNSLTKSYGHGARLMIRRVPDYLASAADEEFPVTRCGSGARANCVEETRNARSWTVLGGGARANRADRRARQRAGVGYRANQFGAGAWYRVSMGRRRFGMALGGCRRPSNGRSYSPNGVTEGVRLIGGRTVTIAGGVAMAGRRSPLTGSGVPPVAPSIIPSLIDEARPEGGQSDRLEAPVISQGFSWNRGAVLF